MLIMVLQAISFPYIRVILGAGVIEIPYNGRVGSVHFETLPRGIYAVKWAQQLDVYPSAYYSYECLIIKPFSEYGDNSIWIHGIRGVFTKWGDRWSEH